MGIVLTVLVFIATIMMFTAGTKFSTGLLIAAIVFFALFALSYWNISREGSHHGDRR